MPLRKLTATGLLAIVLGCTDSLRAVLISSDWDRLKTRAEIGDVELPMYQPPDRGREKGDGPVEPMSVRPRPVPGAKVPYQPPSRPQPAPRPKAPVASGDSPIPTSPSTGPKPTPPITRPS